MLYTVNIGFCHLSEEGKNLSSNVRGCNRRTIICLFIRSCLYQAVKALLYVVSGLRTNNVCIDFQICTIMAHSAAIYPSKNSIAKAISK